MPVERLEIEGSCAESENPALDRAPCDAATLGDVGERDAIGQRLANRVHNDLDPGDLARQRIAGQDTLAVPAILATCQCHREPDE